MFDSAAGLGVKVVQLHRLAAEVAAMIEPGLDGTAAADLLAEVAAAGRQVELATVQLVERVDRSGAWQGDGSRSAAAYLRNSLGQPDGWAKRQLFVGRRLADAMPTVRTMWQAGDIGMAHAGVIAKALDHLDEDLANDVERALAEAAPKISIAQLTSLAELVRQQAAPEQAAEKARKDYESQYVTLSKTFDGQYDLRGRLDPEAGAILQSALDAHTRKPCTGPDGDLRLQPVSAGFRRAEALITIARQALNHADCPASSGAGASGRATVVVTIDAAALAGGYGSGEIDGHTVIAAQAVRRLACDANLLTRTLGRDGQTLDFGRRTRTIPTGLRTYLHVRDGGCAFPGCEAPPSQCEAHHLKHWANGGRTDRNNLILLCRHHHHLVHDDGWTITGDPETTINFYRPGDPTPRPGQRHSTTARAPDLLAG